jgi:hypothetical protein
MYRVFHDIISTYERTAGMLSLSCGTGNFGKFWSACEKHEIHLKIRRIKKCTYNYMFNFVCVLVYILCALKYDENNEKKFLTIVIQNLGKGEAIFSILY